MTRNDLIADIIQRWLGPTRLRLQIPQRKELETLVTSDLKILLELDPESGGVLSDAVKRGLSLGIMTRLVRRRNLALEMADAEQRDVFDVVEHCMSEAELF